MCTSSAVSENEDETVAAGCKVKTALELLGSLEKIPSFIKNAYPVLTTKTNGVTDELLGTILGDVMTGKSFSSISESIRTHRNNIYLHKRLQWLEVCQVYSEAASISFTTSSPFSSTEFSNIESPCDYNSASVPSSTFLVDVFIRYVREREHIFQACMQNVVPHTVQSIDFTFNAAKRTKITTQSGGHVEAIGLDSLLFSLNGTGEISSFRRAKQEGHVYIRSILNELRERCIRLNVPLEKRPKYFYVDNAVHMRGVIHEYFPESEVYQDVKHLINRLIEHTSKQSSLYVEFSKDFHGVFTKHKITVESRVSGNTHKIPAPLSDSQEIVRDLQALIDRYKGFSLAANGGKPLFLNDFDAEWEKQKIQIEENIKDVFIDGKHYFEAEDGKFQLYRGSNRNESMHRRLNSIWPEQCGHDLADCLILAFIYEWNCRRSYNKLEFEYGLSDPKSADCEDHDLSLHNFTSTRKCAGTTRLSNIDVMLSLSLVDTTASVHLTSTAGLSLKQSTAVKTTSSYKGSATLREFSGLKDHLHGSSSHKSSLTRKVDRKKRSADSVNNDLESEPLSQKLKRIKISAEHGEILFSIIARSQRNDRLEHDWNSIAVAFVAVSEVMAAYGEISSSQVKQYYNYHRREKLLSGKEGQSWLSLCVYL